MVPDSGCVVRLVGACAELRVPPLTRGDFETERIASQLQEEGRRSLNGKKTLSRLEVRGQHADITPKPLNGCWGC